MDLEVKLSKNSWHYKLQGFILKEDRPELHSLCPYFWLTIFCLLISPFTLLYRLIMLFVNTFMKYRKRVLDRRAKKFFENMSLEAALDVIENKRKIGDRKYHRHDIWSLIWSWKWHTNRTEEDAEAFYEKLNKEYEKREHLRYVAEEKKQEAKVEMKKKFQLSKVIKYTKLFVGVVISLLLIWLIYLGVNALLHANWHSIGIGLLKLLVLFVFVAIIIFFVIGISKSISNVENYYKNQDSMAWYGYPMYWLFNLIKWPFIGLWAVLKFFFSYFAAAKNNYCPGIIWEEKEPR